MTTAEKNLTIKSNIAEATIFPEGTIQIGDFSYAVPTVVDGENRWGVWTLVSKNNKATKTTAAFDPETVAEDWQAERDFKAAEIQAAKELRAARAAHRSSK